MKLIHIDKVHVHVVSTVGEYLSKVAEAKQVRRTVLAGSPEPRVTTMRDIVASKAAIAPSIRSVFAPRLAA